jgi:hypothetical protein
MISMICCRENVHGIRTDQFLSSGTLDGRHYTLMQQGNFLLWGFSGFWAELERLSSFHRMPPLQMGLHFA